ncbi:hypothetical protein B0H10DRAFT_1940890 [Mycena sp. CBHHK59/15]|nr:hypothetical protein B0H10DRAFT_1940890 [Mycena sp. CBHHK59/15]
MDLLFHPLNSCQSLFFCMPCCSCFTHSLLSAAAICTCFHITKNIDWCTKADQASQASVHELDNRLEKPIALDFYVEISELDHSVVGVWEMGKDLQWEELEYLALYEVAVELQEESEMEEMELGSQAVFEVQTAVREVYEMGKLQAGLDAMHFAWHIFLPDVLPYDGMHKFIPRHRQRKPPESKKLPEKPPERAQIRYIEVQMRWTSDGLGLLNSDSGKEKILGADRQLQDHFHGYELGIRGGVVYADWALEINSERSARQLYGQSSLYFNRSICFWDPLDQMVSLRSPTNTAPFRPIPMLLLDAKKFPGGRGRNTECCFGGRASAVG